MLKAWLIPAGMARWLLVTQMAVHLIFFMEVLMKYVYIRAPFRQARLRHCTRCQKLLFPAPMGAPALPYHLQIKVILLQPQTITSGALAIIQLILQETQTTNTLRQALT